MAGSYNMCMFSFSGYSKIHFRFGVKFYDFDKHIASCNHYHTLGKSTKIPLNSLMLFLYGQPLTHLFPDEPLTTL